MLERLIGIKTLENTEPIVLEEVPDEEAPQMPAEFDHDDEGGINYELDPLALFVLDDDGGA